VSRASSRRTNPHTTPGDRGRDLIVSRKTDRKGVRYGNSGRRQGSRGDGPLRGQGEAARRRVSLRTS
jgi:hypothetical protein